MAGELIHPAGLTGETYQAVLRNAAGEAWRTDTSAFGAWSDAQIANYGIPLAEQGTSGHFVGDFPTAIGTAGIYSYTVYHRAGATLSLTDTKAGLGSLNWDGEAEILPAGNAATLYGASGAIEFVYTVYKPDGITPLPSAAVYVSSDSAGVNRSETQVSDSLGRVLFHLDPGPAFFWRSAPGYVFADPDLEDVS